MIHSEASAALLEVKTPPGTGRLNDRLAPLGHRPGTSASDGDSFVGKIGFKHGGVGVECVRSSL